MVVSLVLGPLGPHFLLDIEPGAPPRLLGTSQSSFKVLWVSSHDLVTGPTVSPPVFVHPAVCESEDQGVAIRGEVRVVCSVEPTPCVRRCVRRQPRR